MDRRKILWLCSWYPNRNDPFDGDFVQRHARAAALYDDIHVIALKPWHSADEELMHSPGLTEQVVYFRKKGALLSRPSDLIRWYRTYKKVIRQYMEKNGSPSLVHVHVPWNAGLLALWMKRKYGMKYVITEHWGIYNELVQRNIVSRSYVFRFLLRKIFAGAERLVSVSRYIADGIAKYITPLPSSLIVNAVDTELFFYKERGTADVFTFLHVSNLAPVKNADGILSAVQILETLTGKPFKLVIAGNRDAVYVEDAKKRGLLGRTVFFLGEISYAAVAAQMQQADCLVLNSISENAPCVIGEALCTGLPVVTTMVGGIPELLDDTNSIRVPVNDPAGLANGMLKVIMQGDRFSRAPISAKARQVFSMTAAGNVFHTVYAS